ncbi:MAG: bifunctional folylpolyglutamate synthase/dihydrofolate synthase, partial [Devosia sp.]|nr:bifunctional folylpolyglutamate synthase/dihydrofolate synthase [Devosia sp.]
KAARRLGITPLYQGEDFTGAADNGRLAYQDEAGLLDLPAPGLIGPHQFENAALAIAAVRHFGLPVTEAQIASGLRNVYWPARLMPLKGKLRDLLPAGDELWLDGGHNAHGAAALAVALEEMQAARPKPLVIILGMMNNRTPTDFLAPFKGKVAKVYGLGIPGEQNAHSAATIAGAAKGAGFDAEAKSSVIGALKSAAGIPGARVVICGSLYLAGDVLYRNGTPPV